MIYGLPTGIFSTLDHGFERLDHIANPGVLQADAGAKGLIEAMGGDIEAARPSTD